MKWNKFRLKTTTEAEDIVSSMLMDLGIQGVEIEDKVPLTSQDKEQMFVDILPQMPEDDGTAFLKQYLRAALFNAPSTIGNYYTSLVAHGLGSLHRCQDD